MFSYESLFDVYDLRFPPCNAENALCSKFNAFPEAYFGLTLYISLSSLLKLVVHVLLKILMPLIFCLFLWSFSAVYTLFSRKIHLRGLNINEVMWPWGGGEVQHMLCYPPLLCSPATSRRRRHTTLNSCCHVSSFITIRESKYFLNSNLPHFKHLSVAY